MKELNINPDQLEILEPSYISRIKRPCFSVSVAAGFPSPAEGSVERTLDLNEHLIERPASTFFVRVTGDSMIGAGIHDKDLLIVDRSLEARNNSIVIAIVGGEFTLKRLKINKGSIVLVPENPEFKAIQINREGDLQIWGVVTNVIHSLK